MKTALLHKTMRFYSSTFNTRLLFFFSNDLQSQGKSAEEIRRIFNITSNDFSGEEDENRNNNNNNMAAAAGGGGN